MSEESPAKTEIADRLRATERELKVCATEQYQTLLNQAQLGVYLVDADFRLREANQVAQTLFGDVPGGLLGRDFDEVVHRAVGQGQRG